jgi:hypothetical protein
MTAKRTFYQLKNKSWPQFNFADRLAPSLDFLHQCRDAPPTDRRRLLLVVGS